MLISIFAGLFLLGFCVFFHELGHYLAGKLVGVRAKIFSIGYGKGRIKKTIGDTTYQITAIPLGGYVQFYGDDITQKHENIKPGDFFSVGPWKRILIALGGPAFSILLGLIVIYFLLLFGWKPIGNKIQLVDSSRKTPAENILKSGDKILSVNGNSTPTFEDIIYHIALSPTKELNLKIERNGATMQKQIIAEPIKEGAPLQIGVRPYGKTYLVVQNDKNFDNGSNILKGDIISKVNGITVDSVVSLRNITDKNMNSVVEALVLRDTGIFFKNDEPAELKKLNIKIPVKEVEYAFFKNVTYLNVNQAESKSSLNQNTKSSIRNSLEIGPWYEEYLSMYKIGGEVYPKWDEFKKALKYHIKKQKGGRIKLIERNQPIKATVSFKKRGMIGLHLGESLEAEKAALSTDFLSLLSQTYKQAVFTTKGTLVGLYRIIEGKLSFRQSVSGPIKIFDYARKSVDLGWDFYWFLLANITIILGIMNLLPIPILDGGHVLIYLIEGIYKPLPIKVIAMGVKAGFVALLTLGIYVIFIDIWDVFLQRFF